MKNIPIKEDLKFSDLISGNFEIKENEHYLKIFSELYDRADDFSLGFVNGKRALKEALRFARKYQDLVDEGFYPPGTQFLIAKDGIILLLSCLLCLSWIFLSGALT